MNSVTFMLTTLNFIQYYNNRRSSQVDLTGHVVGGWHELSRMRLGQELCELLGCILCARLWLATSEGRQTRTSGSQLPQAAQVRRATGSGHQALPGSEYAFRGERRVAQ